MGTKVYPNGCLYVGNWNDGRFEVGKCTYTDKVTYEGDWLEGKPHGYGIRTWPDGRQYEGKWNQGKPYGDGVKVYPNGEKKKGFWREGKFMSQDDYNKHLKEMSLAETLPEAIEKNLKLGKAPGRSPMRLKEDRTSNHS
jgi:hypothetical protein